MPVSSKTDAAKSCFKRTFWGWIKLSPISANHAARQAPKYIFLNPFSGIIEKLSNNWLHT